MPDREKVIEGLEELKQRLLLQKDILGYGYHVGDINDALVLLREQEAVSTIVEQPLNDTRYIFCGACKAMLAQNKPKGYKYCPWCGKKVKWE